MARRNLYPGMLALVLVVAGCDPNSAARTSQPATTGQLTVFAAASTTDVMREAGRRFDAKTGTRVVFSFDSSSNLARQIKAGAPADVFLSADEAWMDDVASAGAIQAGTRDDLLGNRLVFIAPAGEGFDVTLSKELDPAESLSGLRRIAVGDPSHVPAGRYAREALQSLGWWSVLEPRLLPAQDVRAALRLVELGEADAGIVYATDAAPSDRVVVVAEFPADTHRPIRYPVAVCRDADPVAAEFVEFLRSDEMKRVFERAGFQVLAREKRGAADAGNQP